VYHAKASCKESCVVLMPDNEQTTGGESERRLDPAEASELVNKTGAALGRSTTWILFVIIFLTSVWIGINKKLNIFGVDIHKDVAIVASHILIFFAYARINSLLQNWLRAVIVSKDRIYTIFLIRSYPLSLNPFYTSEKLNKEYLNLSSYFPSFIIMIPIIFSICIGMETWTHDNRYYYAIIFIYLLLGLSIIQRIRRIMRLLNQNDYIIRVVIMFLSIIISIFIYIFRLWQYVEL